MGNVKILGTGKFLPSKEVFSKDIDSRLGLKEGYTESVSGVNVRYYVENETSSFMGAIAARNALTDAGIDLKDIDCIVCASGVSEQEIPCMAALIQEKLSDEDLGIPSFDINSTCLSFVSAFDLLSCAILGGRYNKVLIVSSEISSVALDVDDPKSRGLFGDGAAAVILSGVGGDSKVIHSDMKTYVSGAHFSEIKSGGSRLHNQVRTKDNNKDYLFYMDGKKLYKLASKILPDFLDNFMKKSKKTKEEIKLVIPHQASLSAMNLMRDKLEFSKDKFMSIIENHGNVIAASIPMALHEAIKQEKIKRGDIVLMMGISAGVSVGAVLLEY